jgi:hypothetical protein
VYPLSEDQHGQGDDEDKAEAAKDGDRGEKGCAQGQLLPNQVLRTQRTIKTEKK